MITKSFLAAGAMAVAIVGAVQLPARAQSANEAKR